MTNLNLKFLRKLNRFTENKSVKIGYWFVDYDDVDRRRNPVSFWSRRFWLLSFILFLISMPYIFYYTTKDVDYCRFARSELEWEYHGCDRIKGMSWMDWAWPEGLPAY
jgi:hypothetical protein